MGTARSCGVELITLVIFCFKNHILGFYDPCLGEKKQLRIRYEFQERMHEVVVADMDHVALPIRCKFSCQHSPSVSCMLLLISHALTILHLAHIVSS